MTIRAFSKIFAISFLVSALTSCGGGFESSRKESVAVPSTGNRKIWNFNIASEYLFDSSKVAIDSGAASILPVDFDTKSAADFNSGTYIGTQYISSSPLGYLQLAVDGSGTATNGLNALSTPHFSDLVGHWQFEGNFVDSSTEGNDGSVVGDTSTDSSIFKVGAESAIFDKLGDALSIPDDDSLDLDLASSFTIATWVRFSDLAGVQRFLSKGCFDGTSWVNSSYFFSKTAVNEVLFELSSDGSTFPVAIMSSPLVELGQWYHMVATYDGSNVNMYIDGQSEGTAAFVGSVFNGPLPLLLGARADGVGCGGLGAELGGHLDDTAIFKQAFSATEVYELYHHQKQKFSGQYISAVVDAGASITWPSLSWISSLPFMKELGGDINNNGLADSESAGDATVPIYPKLVGNSGTLSGNNLLSNLILYFKFNGTSDYTGVADEVIDHSGGGAVGAPPSPNHGTAAGGNVSAGLGTHYEGRRFDGTGARIEINTFAASPTFTGDKTISFWLKLDTNQVVTTGTTNTIFLDGDGATLSTTIGVHNQTALLADQGKIFVINNDGTNTPTLTSTQALNDGKFHHILFRQDLAGNMELYIDGVSSGSLINSSLGTYGASYRASINHLPASSFSGNIDDLAIWRKSLHPAQVLQLYKRSANRVKFQVKSCVDPTCQCQTLAGTDPNDCDNDTILNAVDDSDSNQAQWLGPRGDSLSEFTELLNNTVIDALAVGTGIVRRESPSLLYSDFSSAGLSLANNRYFQYRILMESSDPGLSCAGTVCVPEVHSVSLGSGSLFAGTVEIENALAFNYSVPIGVINFFETGSGPTCEYNYRLSNDNGTTWYYFNGSVWAQAINDPPGPPAPDYSSATVVQANINSFAPDFGTGTGQFKFKAFIRSTDAITACDLEQIDITLQE